MCNELLFLRLNTARVKEAALHRAEKERRRDEYLDELYCGKRRAMLEEVAYQERAGKLFQEWWDRGLACGYKIDAVKPQHQALLVHYNLHPPQIKLNSFAFGIGRSRRKAFFGANIGNTNG